MSVQEKFEEVFGYPLEFKNEDYPDYLITLNPSHIVALVDISKFDKKIEWKPFVVKELPKDEDVYFEGKCLKVHFLKKIIEVINPNEYGFYKEYDRDKKCDTFVFILKYGSYGVMLPAAYPSESEKDKGKKKIQLTETIKKIPKDVLVL